MQARVGWLLHGSQEWNGWCGCALEVWDDRRREATAGGVQVAAEDIVLERAARAGLLAPARWVVTADAARVQVHGGAEWPR